MEKFSLEDIAESLPWTANGIYLEKKNKQVAAVCSSDAIAKVLANCVNHYGSMSTFDTDRMHLYKKFIETAYYLSIAISKANIPVNSIETQYVERAYHEFSQALEELITKEKISIEPIEK